MQIFSLCIYIYMYIISIYILEIRKVIHNSGEPSIYMLRERAKRVRCSERAAPAKPSGFKRSIRGLQRRRASLSSYFHRPSEVQAGSSGPRARSSGEFRADICNIHVMPKRTLAANPSVPANPSSQFRAPQRGRADSSAQSRPPQRDRASRAVTKAL